MSSSQTQGNSRRPRARGFSLFAIFGAVLAAVIVSTTSQAGAAIFPPIRTTTTTTTRPPTTTTTAPATTTTTKPATTTTTLPGSTTTTLPGATTTTVAPTTTVPAAPKLTEDVKILVIAADGTETDYPAITAFLDQQGMPYTKLVASTTPLTAATLQDSPTHGLYNGIVLTTGNLTYLDPTANTWQSALTPDEWTILHTYQSTFGVRSLTSYTYPEAAYGLTYVGYQDTLAAPLTGTLTTAGQSVFTNVKATAAIPLTGAWAYFGTVNDPTVTTPLMTTTVGGQTYPIASVTQFTGYQNLAITIANNPYLTHSLLLAPGWINWVTKGVSLGARHANMDAQVDDLFLTDDMWNTTTHAAGPGTSRSTAADITALVNWQNGKKAQANHAGLKLEFPYVGSGVVTSNFGGGLLGQILGGLLGGLLNNDPLVKAVQANKSQFGFINHTYDHYNLDCGDCENPTGVITTTAAKIKSEITTNLAEGVLLGLPTDATQMVQPDISGINTPNNPMAQKAAADAGVRLWISDTSHAGQNNPSFNTGFYAPGDSRLFISPRRPSNLFYSTTTPDQWVDVYNYFYAPGGTLCAITTCFTAPQTYAQILDHESNYFLQFLLQGDDDSWMFHTPNVTAYDGTHSVLSDLLDATFAKYDALVNAPIRSLSFGQVGADQQARGAYNASGVTATVTPCTSLTLHATNAATIPVTGVSYTASNSTVETYAGLKISNVTLTAGQTVTIPLPAC